MKRIFYQENVDKEFESVVVTENEEEIRETKDNYFLLAAFLPTLIAFLSWEKISFGLSELLDMFGVINTESGNVFANNLLRPTITGKSAFVWFYHVYSCGLMKYL